jgi:DDE superfamily endonuclease
MLSLPPEMIVLLAPFAQLFSDRVWLHAQVLVLGAILVPGNRTVSSCLRVMGLGGEEHFTNYHRVLNRVTWSAVQASKILLGLLVQVVVPPGATIVLGADDTVERRSGRQIKAKGVLPRCGAVVAQTRGQVFWAQVGVPDVTGPGPLGPAGVGVTVFDSTVLAAQVAAQAPP